MSANRLAALTGVAFLILAIISIAVGGGEPPDPTDDSAEEIIDFYVDEKDGVMVGAALQTLAAAALVFFGGYLRKVLHAAEGAGHMLSAVTLAGAAILATGLALDATINFALAETADDIEPSAAQALSALWSNDFLVFSLGAFVFILSAGLSVVRHGALPTWLGWVAIVIGVLAITPVGFFAFLAAALWIVVVSVMLALREGSATA